MYFYLLLFNCQGSISRSYASARLLYHNLKRLSIGFLKLFKNFFDPLSIGFFCRLTFYAATWLLYHKQIDLSIGFSNFFEFFQKSFFLLKIPPLGHVFALQPQFGGQNSSFILYIGANNQPYNQKAAFESVYNGTKYPKIAIFVLNMLNNVLYHIIKCLIIDLRATVLLT